MKKENKTEDTKADKATDKKEVTNEETNPKQPLRKIVIETDGNTVFLREAQVAGKIELISVLQTVITYANQQQTPETK